MGYAIAAPAQAVVPIDATTDLFPVHRIYCVGRNFAGTPEGVEAVKAGDLMAGGIAGIGTLQVRVV